MKIFSIGLVLAEYFAIGIVILWLVFFSNLSQNIIQAPSAELNHIVIPKGSSYCRALTKLKNEGWDIPQATCYYGRLLGLDKSLQSGEILLDSCCSNLGQLMTLLQSGKVYQYRIEFPSGSTVKDILQLLQAVPDTQMRQQINAVNARSLANELQSNYASLEGLLFPDTYFYNKGSTDLEIVKKSMEKIWQEAALLWPSKAASLPFSSIYEAIILASIIEKEAKIDAERPIIASVYINRLKQNMKLDADPTVIYGLLDYGIPFNGRLYHKHLKIDTPYNTYLHKGLPPTPIGAVSRKSLAAALQPATTDFLFFVANASGHHIFAQTYAEHLKNVAEQRKK